jgi:predicted nucleotidyltransferase
MDKTINITIINYIKLIRKKYPNFENAYLFGSFAKGYQGKDSDIDLALIFTDLNNSERFNIQVQLMLLASDIDSRIEPHPISRIDFQSNNPFVTEIQNTGIKISA